MTATTLDEDAARARTVAKLVNQISEIQAKLAEVLALAASLSSPTATPAWNPSYFKNGRKGGHLTPRGLARLFDLFEQKFTIDQAAEAMHISRSACSNWRAKWSREQQGTR